MRSLAHLLCFTISISWLCAQNLVPNGSFEEYTTCPTADSQIDFATGWDNYLYSPDFWHACGIPDTSGVPTNIIGYQQARTGLGYGGLHAFTADDQLPESFREFMGIALSDTLEVGTLYHLAFFASWTTTGPGTQGSMRYAHNKLGAFFSTEPKLSYQGWYPLPNYAHVYTEDIITDSLGWVEVSGEFEADSNYRYLYLGNFFNDAQTDDTLLNPLGQFDLSYYYIDDVCLTVAGANCGLLGIEEPDTVDPDEGDEKAQRPLIHPIPFSHEVFITSSTSAWLPTTFTFFDLTGRIVAEGHVDQAGQQGHITLPDLPTGTYLLQLVLRDGTLLTKRVQCVAE